LADDAEGKVSFEAKVDPQGRVSLCTVTVSSGTASLDDATCNLVTQRALFVPARDKRGKPTEGIYRSRVVWTMKSHAMPHPNSESYSTTFVVEADGTVTDCRIDNPALDAPTLARALAGCGKAQYEPYTDNAGDPVRRRVRWTVKAEVAPVEP
jgi:protein TonB